MHPSHGSYEIHLCPYALAWKLQAARSGGMLMLIEEQEHDSNAPPKRFRMASRAATRHSAPDQRHPHRRPSCRTVPYNAGIPGSVEFKEGKSGSPMVVLKHSCGSSAEVRYRCRTGTYTVPAGRSCNRLLAMGYGSGWHAFARVG